MDLVVALNIFIFTRDCWHRKLLTREIPYQKKVEIRVHAVFNQSEFILGPPPPRSGPDRQIGILRVDIELV